MRIDRSLPFVIVLALFAVPDPAAAWSPEGHQIIARLAASHLTKAAESQVEDLLDGDADDAMAKASTWADEIVSKRPETKAWHFVNIPVAEAGYSAERDCPDGNCAVVQIAAEMKLLGDKTQPKAARAEALKFLINLMGDIHQPLRCGSDNNDHGAKVNVSLGGRSTTLLAVWDTEIIAAMQGDVPQLVSRLGTRISPAMRRQWARGTVIGWCEESAQAAKAGAYDDLQGAASEKDEILLMSEYPDGKRKMEAEQLQKAGVRLAAALNFTLK